MDQGPAEDIKEYSVSELKQLKDLLTQSQDHYKKILTEPLKEGDLFALKLCLEETETQIKEVDDELKSRTKKND